MHPPPGDVDGLYLVEGTCVDIVLITKSLRRTSDQRLDVVDNPADVVGDPSGGVGGVGTAFEGDDFKLGPSPTRLRRRAHARRIAADHDKSLSSHGAFASVVDDGLRAFHA